ncbi:MAG: Crp/Fnr family transcriptional regulator [Prevotella sp.]|uniref:Crp/Fnr family transcriptional regulator n=1 Tax=Prevotella sp. AGR2160 TaxID=1280674 RepID=UPI00042516CE|nr:Crp/Fnr family transcriptional regulator [Prevotella sp. AGR2160]MDD5862919.1 Crp/Fnr family transcriptional regulator [Prevotella sp.]
MKIRHHLESKDKIVEQVSAVLGGLSVERRMELTEVLTMQSFRKGGIVYRESECPLHIFFLVRGKVKIYKEGINGREQIVRVYRPDEFFGYRAFFAHEIYRTTAKAFEPSVVVEIPFTFIRRLMEEDFCVARFFIVQLSKELGRSDERTVHLTQKHIRGRLADTLCALVDRYGFEDDGKTLDVTMSREDLASMSNMTTSNAIRTLSTFVEEGLVATKGRMVQLLRVDKIKEIAREG